MIRRVPRTQNFTVVPNEIIRHPEMSWETKSVLVFILSMPDNYTITQKKLNEDFPRGRRFYQRVIDEAWSFGYAGREARSAALGRWEGQDYEVHDTPQTHLIASYQVELKRKAERASRRQSRRVSKSGQSEELE